MPLWRLGLVLSEHPKLHHLFDRIFCLQQQKNKNKYYLVVSKYIFFFERHITWMSLSYRLAGKQECLIIMLILLNVIHVLVFYRDSVINWNDNKICECVCVYI